MNDGSNINRHFRRRWLQLSLRSLLLLTVLVAVYVAGWVSGRESVDHAQPVGFADVDKDGQPELLFDAGDGMFSRHCVRVNK